MRCESNEETVGLTPLVRLRRVVPQEEGAATVLAKIEARNPGFSVKDRPAREMIADALATGALKPGMEILEPTSGNTGIALALMGSARGLKTTLVMPESFSVERRKVLKAAGATIVLTERQRGMPGAVEKAEAMLRDSPGRYWMPRQFSNPANARAHERTTGPEIWDATNGRVDVFVAGVGTGGTITGASRFLKARNPQLISVAVEPAESPVLTQTRQGKPLLPGPHLIQGIGAGFVPQVLDLSLCDRIVTVTGEEAIAMARRLATEEGLLCGVSSGAAAAAAARIAALPEFRGKTIVVVLPDGMERYLSGPLFDGICSNVATAKAGDTI